LAVVSPAGTARAPEGWRDLELTHEAVQVDQLVGLEGVEPLAAEQFLVAGSDGDELVDRVRLASVAPRGCRRRSGRALGPGAVTCRRAAIDARSLIRGRGHRACVVGNWRVLAHWARPEDAREHRLECLDLRRVRDENRPRCAVQPPAADWAHELQ